MSERAMDWSVRHVCRCGHSPELHAANRYACILRYNREGCGMSVARGRQRCGCQRYREARWLELHSPIRHLAVRLWWKVPVRAAWWVIEQIRKARPDLRYCDLVESVLPIDDPSRQDDYRSAWSCLCDVMLPTDARPPSGRFCYCREWGIDE